MEEWKRMDDHGGLYEISSYGKVYSHKVKRLLTHNYDITDGYVSVRVCINGKKMSLARLLGYYFLPDGKRIINEGVLQMDHIDEDTLNNHIANLRFLTNAENTRRHSTISTNTTGYRGVKKSGKNSWRAAIESNGITISLGTYPTKLGAHLAYRAKNIELFGRMSPYWDQPKYKPRIVKRQVPLD